MRICHISAGYPPDIGGLETVVASISLNETQMGHNVHVISQGQTFKSIVDKNGITIHRLKYDKNEYLLSQMDYYHKLKYIIRYIQYHVRVIQTIREIKPDIIHVHNLYESLLIPIVRYANHIPYILTLHGTWSGGIMYPDKLQRFWKYSPWLRVPDYVTVLTERRRDECLPHRSERLAIIGNGVDNSIYTPKNILDTRRKDPIIITVSRLVQKKGLEDAITSMSQLKKDYPNAKLMILGSGPLESYLQSLISSLNLESNVELVGFVNRDTISSYYHLADVYLLPSLDEGMPMVALEAMSCGLPLISTDVSILPDIINEHHNGYLIPKNDSRAIALMVKKIHEMNTRDYTLMCSNSLVASRKYSWDAVTQSYISLYEKSIRKVYI